MFWALSRLRLLARATVGYLSLVELVPQLDPHETDGYACIHQGQQLTKSGRSSCKISQEKIEKDEVRVGLPIFARGQQVTSWAKASELSLIHISEPTRPY